ncbi:AMP-binding protein [Chryseobacterium sp.]|uniref:AMP-binding protein n=1 Tax=Chryseobacterium sp. TaxID=1871047 RepID=UPI0011CB1D32|nr:AMP-binding protein [Chryseobacterium sp.]TXF77363.1 AMP-binding protein [Chryseobacterium sp.]
MTIDFKDFNMNRLSDESDFEEKVQIFLKEWFSPSKAVAVQTSGSTGAPKIFQIEKNKMLSSAQMTCDFLKLKEGDSALLCLPVEYISGKMMLVRSISRKLKLTVKNPTSNPLENLSEEFDFCAMSPLQVENSLEKIHLIRNLIIGGAKVSENLKQKIHQAGLKNSKIYETYGMSETLSHIALKQIYPVVEEYFTVFKGIEIDLDDRGCLIINAPKLSPEIIRTNDLVELIGDQKFKFIGRFDNVINSGGLKIHPEKLEALVSKKLPNEVVFSALNDERLGQKLILIVEGEDSEELRHKIADVLDEIEVSLSKNHRPKEIFYLPKFSRIPNGKINRKELLNLVQPYQTLL